MNARFFARGPFVPGDVVELEGDELHHAARVSRVREGELVELVDGCGAAAAAVVRTVTKSSVALEICEAVVPSRESSLSIELAQALIQPEKFELVLQKACELGVARITPLISERIDTLHALTRALLEKETLDAPEIDAIINGSASAA